MTDDPNANPSETDSSDSAADKPPQEPSSIIDTNASQPPSFSTPPAANEVKQVPLSPNPGQSAENSGELLGMAVAPGAPPFSISQPSQVPGRVAMPFPNFPPALEQWIDALFVEDKYAVEAISNLYGRLENVHEHALLVNAFIRLFLKGNEDLPGASDLIKKIDAWEARENAFRT